MPFFCHSKILRKHCLQFLLGVKMAPGGTENKAYAKFGVTNKEHYGMLWYFLEWSMGTFLLQKWQGWRRKWAHDVRKTAKWIKDYVQPQASQATTYICSSVCIDMYYMYCSQL